MLNDGGQYEHLPNDEIVVVVINNGGDAAVGVDLQIFRSFLFFFAKIEVHRFVRQP